jgi:hypothetical protein
MNGAPTLRERELLERLQGVLRTEFRRVGHGSQKRVLEQLELKKSSFDSAFSRGSVKILMLLRVLEALGVEPGRFFAQAFPADEVPPPGLPPVGVRTVMSRMGGEGRG